MWGKSESLQNSFMVALACVLTHVCLQVDFNSKNTLTAERQTFYCVPIPGENAWVKEISLSSRLDQVSLLDTFTGAFLSAGFAASDFQFFGFCTVFLTQTYSYASSSQARVVPSTSYVPTRQKRSYEEDDDDDDMDDMDTQPQKQREPDGQPDHFKIILLIYYSYMETDKVDNFRRVRIQNLLMFLP